MPIISVEIMKTDEREMKKKNKKMRKQKGARGTEAIVKGES